MSERSRNSSHIRPSGRHASEALRVVPMSVYTSTDEPPEKLLRALGHLVRVCGLTVVHESDVERGSWFRSWRMRESRAGALRRLSRLAAKVERAGELRYIQGARSESDEHEANAVATVIKALSETDAAAIQLSSMVVVKADNRIICRVLSEPELRILNDHPELLRSPGDLLTLLSSMIGEQNPVGGRPLVNPENAGRRRRYPSEEDDSFPFDPDAKAAPPVIGL
jgi:hypothetical protein